MARYKITVLTPLHIGTGNSYSENFNMLCKGGFVYLYDEFKLVDFLLSKGEYIPQEVEKLKEKIRNYKDKIIKSNLHLRKIKSDFSSLENKDVLENVSSSNKPIVTGSSIKGAIRTAILNSLQLKDERSKDLYNCLKNKDMKRDRFEKTKDTFDKDFMSLFTYLKISDSIESNLNTQIFKSINIKKNKEYQSSREKRVFKIQNNVECISAKQMFYIDIKDESIKKYGKNIFSNLGNICNKFYLNAFNKEKDLYFKTPLKVTLETNERLKKLGNEVFLLNIGRFSGAEMKSLDNFRYIKNSKATDKKESSTRTFALKNDIEDNVYFENELLPFGWVLCELVKE